VRGGEPDHRLLSLGQPDLALVELSPRERQPRLSRSDLRFISLDPRGDRCGGSARAASVPARSAWPCNRFARRVASLDCACARAYADRSALILGSRGATCAATAEPSVIAPVATMINMRRTQPSR